MAGTLNLVEPKVTWNKTEVRVCFAEYKHYAKSQFSETIRNLPAKSFGTFSADQKNTIKAAVSREYTRDKTGIRFTGWKDCSKDPSSDAYLFRVVDDKQIFTGLSSMGDSGELTYIDYLFGKKI